MNIKRYFQSEPSNLESLSSSSSSKPSKIDLDDLPWDPSERKPISSYHPTQKDKIRRAYLLRGPHQPTEHDFPQTNYSGKLRRLNPEWYTGEFGNWLEYSVETDKAYCLYCYLFKESGCSEAFVSEGVRCWQKAREKFGGHVGKCDSFHNKARKKGEDLLMRDHAIDVVIDKVRLNASIRLAKALLNGAIDFCGDDESETYRGHFIEFLELFGELNEEISEVVLSSDLGNNQMTVLPFQKEICNCFAEEVLKKIFEELGDDVFSILIDESRDVSEKEQVAVVLRYVDKLGFVKERFIGLVEVMEISALSLKSAIDELFARHGLSFGRVRGQVYGRASSMFDEFNDLKALILKENSSAYYVHCFAHQLHHVVVALATKHHEIYKFFKEVSDLVNVVGASCQPVDSIRECRRERLGLNPQLEVGTESETNLERLLAPSHEKTVLRLLALYPTVIDVLEYIETSGEISADKSQAIGLHIYMKTFSFVFYLHLMKHILCVTSALCGALQRKDQDIMNAVELVKSTKEDLKSFRLEGFDSLLEDVTSFCDKYDIEVVDMKAEYVDPICRRRKTGITNRDHYVVNNFNTVVDMQIEELENRFNEVTTNLLTCMSSLSPSGSFCAFNKLNLLKLAEMHPYDFNSDEIDELIYELGDYITDVKEDERFDNLNVVSDLAKMMVETRKHIDYPLVYRLIKLSLVLPVETASVVRCFSSMNDVKADLCNYRTSDGYMNDPCICYIERELFQQVSVEDAMQRFQMMESRREQS